MARIRPDALGRPAGRLRVLARNPAGELIRARAAVRSPRSGVGIRVSMQRRPGTGCRAVLASSLSRARRTNTHRQDFSRQSRASVTIIPPLSAARRNTPSVPGTRRPRSRAAWRPCRSSSSTYRPGIGIFGRRARSARTLSLRESQISLNPRLCKPGEMGGGTTPISPRLANEGFRGLRLFLQAAQRTRNCLICER